jgi:hypothetical protein
VSAPIAAAVIVAALTAGYALGRVRPLDLLDTWVWRQFTFGGPWLTGSRPRQVVLLAAHTLVRPAATWHAWRHRHDPPPRRSPAPTIRRNTEEPRP